MTIKRLLLSGLFLILICNISLAQKDKKIYSRSLSKIYSDPSININTLLDSSDYYLESNRDKSFKFLEEAYLLSLQPENKRQQYKVYRKLGGFYEYNGQADLAAINYKKSIEIENADDALFEYMLKAGKQFELAQQSSKSIEIYREYYSKISDFSIENLRLSEAFGDAFLQQQMKDSAFYYYTRAEQISDELSLAEENTLIKLKLATTLGNKDDSMAYSFLNTANNQAKSKDNTGLKIKTESSLADYYQRNNMPEREIQSRNTIIKDLEVNKEELESQKVDVDAALLEEQVKIAKTYNQQNKHEDAIDILFDEDLEPIDTDNTKNIEIKKEAAKTRSEAFMKSGNEKEALKSYEQYVKLLDQLFLQKELQYNDVKSLNSLLSEHQFRIEALEKDKALYDAELQLFEQERENQQTNMRYKNWFLSFMAVLILLLAFALLMMYQRYKIQQWHNLQLDLKSLRTQMNPHFIFNAFKLCK